MRIGGVISVRNEAELIELNLKYHLEIQGFDIIIAVDNGSTDRTYNIMKDMKDPRIIVNRTLPGIGFAQSQICTKGALELFNKYGCDWALPIDGDEFWHSRNYGTIRNVLELFPSHLNILETGSYRFHQTELDDPIEENFFLRRLTYAELETFGEVNFKVVMQRLGSQIKYLPAGNHWVELNEGSRVTITEVDVHDVCRFHYRFLDCKSFKKRIVTYAEGLIQRHGPEWLNGTPEEAPRMLFWYKKHLEGSFDDENKRRFVWSEDKVKKGLAENTIFHIEDMRKIFPVERKSELEICT